MGGRIMKLFLTLVVALSAALPMMDATAIVGSRELAAEVRIVESFHSIRITNAADVTITQGSEQSVTIRTDSNILPLIETEVEHGCLVISDKEKNLKPSELKIDITMPKVTEIAVSGASDINSKGVITAESLQVDVSGAADVILSLDVENLETRVSGVGDFRMDGRAGTHDIRISGVGDVQADTLESKTTHVMISGKGECVVHVTEKLDVAISGMGNVNYKGSPKITQNVTGMGTVAAVDGE